MNLSKMDHVSLTVRDVDKSVDFYTKGLGLKLLRISELHPSPETQFKNAYMYSDNFLLEVITAVDSATQLSPPPSWQSSLRATIGITHLGVRVKNLEKAMARLEAAGARKVGGPFEISTKTAKMIHLAKRVPPTIKYARKPGRKPWRNAVFCDPDGVVIELVER